MLVLFHVLYILYDFPRRDTASGFFFFCLIERQIAILKKYFYSFILQSRIPRNQGKNSVFEKGLLNKPNVRAKCPFVIHSSILFHHTLVCPNYYNIHYKTVETSLDYSRSVKLIYVNM